MDARRLTQDEHYARAAADFGAALSRLARAYERDADRQRDLLQDIHFALWRSFESFQGLSSLRTWVYRVAHNTAATHVLKDRRARVAQWVDLDHIADAPDPATLTDAHAESDTLNRLMALVHTPDLADALHRILVPDTATECAARVGWIDDDPAAAYDLGRLSYQPRLGVGRVDCEELSHAEVSVECLMFSV